MPELAELKLTADYINKASEGKTFKKIKNNPEHKWKPLLQQSPNFKIKAESRGKELILYMGNKNTNTVTRSDFCDESKTRIFRHASVKNRIAVLLYDIETETLGKFMADENMQKVTKFLGEKEESKVIKVLSSHL